MLKRDELTDPDAKTADWKGDTFARRIHQCRVMLHAHGFLTDAQNDAVKAKQVKRGLVPKSGIML